MILIHGLYLSITLEDGTVFGGIVIKDSENVFDYVIGVLSEKAASMEFELHTDYNDINNSMYFIMSNPESLIKFISYMMRSREGDLARPD